MKFAIELGAIGPKTLQENIDWVQHAERLGATAVFSAEAWWSDAATVLAFIADKTSTIRLGTGIMQITARTPAMTAMTALTLHDLSGGRFILGLGASGPQVVEGLHGVPYRRSLTRLKETVDICRQIFAGEKVRYDGRVHQLPLPGGEGKPIRVAHEPTEIPIYLATLGPKSLQYTGEAADGWLGTSFNPDRADAHLDFLADGAAKAGRTLNDLDVCVSVRVDMGDDVEKLIQGRKQGVAFSMGAMGSATTNFYNDAYRRGGFEEDARAVQALWLEGKREEAAARVPDEMVMQFQAVGDRSMVRERLQKYADAGVGTVKLGLDSAPMGPERFKLLESIAELMEEVS